MRTIHKKLITVRCYIVDHLSTVRCYILDDFRAHQLDKCFGEFCWIKKGTNKSKGLNYVSQVSITVSAKMSKTEWNDRLNVNKNLLVFQ